MFNKIRILIACCLCGCTCVSAQVPGFVTDSIEGYIARGMKNWDLPGLSIVIVKDGKTVLMKGYGVKKLGGEAVDPETLFMIASNTKLFTGTALALLENSRRLSLDDKITKYFPEYRLYDPAVSSLVTIRDLLSHRIGTKTFQGDFTFWNTKFNRRQIMNKMRLLKPAGQFRQGLGYCNSCFLTAGEVIPVVTRQPWEVFVYDSIIVPLEMNNTHMLSTGIASRKNVATPYTTSYTEQLAEVPYDQWDNLAPAASIISNVNDLSHWLQFQLDSGKYNHKSIMPFEVLQVTRDVNNLYSSRKSGRYPVHFAGYGLGVFTSDYNGRQIYWHTGGAGGMVSNVCFVPEENLGIAILTNNDNQEFFEALRLQVLDAYLGVPYTDRSAQRLRGFTAERNKQLRQIAQWRQRLKNSKPVKPLASYTGTYANPIYGNIVITGNGNKLEINFTNHLNLRATLQYMDDDEWLLEYSNVEFGVFAVTFDTTGPAVTGIPIKMNEYVESDPYLFEKK